LQEANAAKISNITRDRFGVSLRRSDFIDPGRKRTLGSDGLEV